MALTLTIPHKVFTLIFFIMFLNGLYISSYGVLIPYYSAATHNDQTYFSFIFMVRSAAFILGSIAVKTLVLHYSLQRIVACNIALVSLSLFLCSLSLHSFSLTLTLFASAFATITITILSYSIIFNHFQHNKPQTWMLAAGIGFGMGATLAPPIIAALQFHTYQLTALLYLATLPVLAKLPLAHPEQLQTHTQETPKQYTNSPSISRHTELYICAIMLLFPAQEVGLAGWMPTYAIKASVSDIYHSGIYSLLFWLPNFALRIVWVLLPFSVTTKLRTVLTSLLALSFIFLLLQYLELYHILCILTPVTFGAMTSLLYGFCMTLSVDHGFKSNTSNNANFILANCIGEGLLAGPMGYSMQLFGFHSLFVIILLACTASYAAFRQAVTHLHADKLSMQQKETLIELPNMRAANAQLTNF